MPVQKAADEDRGWRKSLSIYGQSRCFKKIGRFAPASVPSKKTSAQRYFAQRVRGRHGADRTSDVYGHIGAPLPHGLDGVENCSVQVLPQMPSQQNAVRGVRMPLPTEPPPKKIAEQIAQHPNQLRGRR